MLVRTAPATEHRDPDVRLVFGLSNRDLEQLLAARGMKVNHVTLHRWVQHFTRVAVDAVGLPTWARSTLLLGAWWRRTRPNSPTAAPAVPACFGGR
jgi:hypothetical protein